jgi:hypothetical protein
MVLLVLFNREGSDSKSRREEWFISTDRTDIPGGWKSSFWIRTKFSGYIAAYRREGKWLVN